jgi:thiol-disulfide isomerase/thioredoxin
MKRNLKYKLFIMALLAICKASAQNGAMSKMALPHIPNLTIGDQVPDFEIPEVINTNNKTARFSDFKDQLVIIDFWSTGCPGCVEALPKMDALQKEFGSKVKILPVTYENKDVVLAFWKHNRLTKTLTIPSVVNDRLFLSYFRYNIFPHEVWVYKDKVVAITGPDHVDAASITKVLSGAIINWPVKNDFYVFDGTKTLLFPPDAGDTGKAFKPYIKTGGYREQVNGDGYGNLAIIRDTNKKTVRAFFLNWPIYNAYLFCWNNTIRLSDLIKPVFELLPNQVSWEVADKAKYIFVPGTGYRQEWLEQHGICFESVKPDTGQSDKDVYRSMIADMDKLLGLHVRWEKRKEKVLVLIRTTREDRLKSKTTLTGEDERSYIVKGTLYQFRDWALSNLSYQMNQFEDNPYVFDETNYKDRVDMNLNIPSWTDIPSIRKALEPYGLDLKEEDRVVDRFVFSEVRSQPDH